MVDNKRKKDKNRINLIMVVQEIIYNVYIVDI